MPQDAPTFAASVPVYGYADWLGDTLDSLRAQKVPLKVAVLDATPDDSVQRVLDSYRDMIDYSYHHADDGQSAAINEGWKALQGDILFWLNADDFLFPNALEQVAAIFAAEPDVDVVYGHSVHITGDGAFLEYFPSISENPQDLKNGCCIAQPACFVRRRAIEQVGYLETARHFTMDWDLWCRLLDHGARFKFLDAPLSLVRLHEETKTASGAARRFSEVADVAGRYNGSLATRLLVLRFTAFDKLNGHGPTAAVLRGLRALRRRLRFRRRIFGVEVLTNVVAGRCTLHLATYRGTPGTLTFHTDRPGTFLVDGHRSDSAGPDATGWIYKVPLPHGTRAISATIEDVEGRPWKLLGACFETDAA